MADLTELLSAQNVKVSLSDSTGVEQAYLSANIGNADSGTPRVVLATNQTEIPVQGDVANAATDSGNPVKVGGVYNTTLPSLSNGQRGQMQVDENSFQVTIDDLRFHANQARSFTATTNNVLIGTSETALFLFRNPNASGKVVKIYDMIFTGAGTFRVYHSPTITANGTTITPVNNKLGGAAGVALTTFSPTASANGSLARLFAVTAQNGPYADPDSSYLILPANTSILVTAQMAANNTTTNCLMRWLEV